MRLLSKLGTILHWERPKRPEVNLSDELYEQLKPFRLPFILLQLGLFFSTLGYLVITDYTLIEAFFQSSYTFTTTGFGALKENQFDGLAVIYTALVMLAGSTILSFATISIIDILNRGKIIAIIKERKMIYRIARLKKHFVICYHNEYTIQLSRQLRESHIPFVVVDPCENFEEIAHKNRYPYFVKAEPHTEIAILKAHLSSAKGVITVSKNPADNIAQIVSVRLFEKELKRKPYYIMSSAENDEDMARLKKLGSDVVVSPTRLMAERINMIAIRPDLENVLDRFVFQKNTPLVLEEVTVSRVSWMALKKIKDTHLNEILQIRIVGITQKGGKFVSMPKGDTVVTSECKLLLIGSPNDIQTAKKMIGRHELPKELQYV